MAFSDYVVFVDESGDHGLKTVNPEYPVFVLAFCVCRKDAYLQRVVPLIQQLKFDFWGHDAVVLHSYEIRKSKGDFAHLLVPEIRTAFQNRMNEVMQQAEFTLIAAVIDKARLVQLHARPNDPYEIALASCLDRLQMFLRKHGQVDRSTHVLVECRGKTEDEKLELEFRRICDGANRSSAIPNLEIRFVDKKHNASGLQLADLVAYPVGRHVLKREQSNRAYDIVAQKFWQGEDGRVEGYGLKQFP